MRFVVCVCILLATVAAPLGAQTDPSTPTVQALLERIQKLEQRVAELEKKQEPGKPASLLAEDPPATAAPPTAPVAGARNSDAQAVPGQHEHPGASPQNAAENEVRYPTLQLRGFTDIVFSAQDERGSTSGFNLGQFIMHFSGGLSPKVSYFGELSWTATPTGYNAEVERSLVRYDYNDHLKLSFGRYHTPINYWNTAFHHGLWLQTTVSRPEMIQFGGRLIPVHFIGALAEGTVPGTRSINLNYNIGLGNGRGSIISRAGDAGDINNNRAWLVNIYSKPDWAYGWQAGASFYRDKITLLFPTRNFREWIESAHIAYTKEKPEFLAEVANIHHSGLERPGDFNSQAWYVQVAYRLPWAERVWKPYYRFEYIHIPASEPVFKPAVNPLPNLAGSVVGIRYDITSYAAIKAEYRHSRRDRTTTEPNGHHVNGLFLQTSLTF